MKQTFFLLMIVAASYSLTAQDFSGTWIQQSKEHISGPEYGNAIQNQMTVAQNKDSVIITTVSAGANGQNVNNRMAMAMNGKPTIIIGKASKRKFTSNVVLSADKKGMTITTVYSMPDNENETDFTRVETWTLSADGKQLNIDKKSMETRSETWEVKAVFVKQ